MIIDKKIKFHTHTSAVIKKANRILGLIKIYFSALDETKLPIFFTSMVRAHLEYGNDIWGSDILEDMKAIERVQKRATRMLTNLRELPYTKRLETCSIFHL